MANLSDFFNKAKKTLGEAVDKTAETVGDLTQTGKYKLEISKYNSQIKEVQNELGKALIQAKTENKSNEELLKFIDEAHEKVLKANEEIERVEKLIVELNNKDEIKAEVVDAEEVSSSYEEVSCCESELSEEVVDDCCTSVEEGSDSEVVETVEESCCGSDEEDSCACSSGIVEEIKLKDE